MSAVTENIITWARTLPYWEQATLQKIIDGKELKQNDYDELLQYLLEDTGLVAASGNRSPLNISQTIVENEQKPIQKRRLTRIFGVKNVNALAPNQELTFSPNLTVIYGNNGSGKSGYARIIGNASFTRGDKQVLVDVTKKYDPYLKQTVCLEFDGEEGSYVLEHELGNPCSEMNVFHVFDSTSARVHLTKQNTLSFVPSGLQYLTRLAEVTDTIRNQLDREIAQRRQINPFIIHFDEETKAKNQIMNLGSKTDMKLLRKLAELSGSELRSLEESHQRITNLQSQDTENKVQQNQQVIDDLLKLSHRLRQIETPLSEANIEVINSLISEWQDRSAFMQDLSREQLQAGKAHALGTTLWLNFVESAHALVTEGTPEAKSYPQREDTCLFCNQPLSDSARHYIERLWSLLESDAQSRLIELEKQLQDNFESLEGLELDFFNDQLVSYRHLGVYSPEILTQIQIFLENNEKHQQQLLEAIKNRKTSHLPRISTHFFSGIQEIVERLEETILELRNSSKSVIITQIRHEQTELRHRQKLGQLLPEIERYVQNAQWIAKAESSGVKRSTHHISRQYNLLFEKLVTQRYIELFEKHLELLKFPAKIKIITKGQKGETLKQIALKMDESMPTRIAQTDKVLSEGEQKAVALADFLTEVVLDDNCSAIVLDDPVTSLDFDWKYLIAPILVKESIQQYGGLDCQDNFGQGFKVGLAPFYSLTFRAKVASLGPWNA